MVTPMGKMSYWSAVCLAVAAALLVLTAAGASSPQHLAPVAMAEQAHQLGSAEPGSLPIEPLSGSEAPVQPDTVEDASDDDDLDDDVKERLAAGCGSGPDRRRLRVLARLHGVQRK